jgi:hypothetical protein
MRVTTALCLLPLLCAACSKSPPGPSPAPSSNVDDEQAHLDALKKMTVDEVEQRLQAKDARFFVFDANMPEVYAKGHVPSATLVPEGGVTASLLPKDKAATLVFYCSNEH